MIGLFLEDCPDASYDDCVQAFGSPAYMAREMLCDVPEEEIQNDCMRRKRFHVICILCLLAVAVLSSAAAIFLYTHPVR